MTGKPAARTTIAVQGARVHNLKNISLEIPRDRLIVVTGLSGSGKSSLAFDTIYAEGQRRYMESLSTYAKRFVSQVAKPDVDFVYGLSPVISIEQKTTGSNPRSTVGTMTDIASYLNLLFATIGDPHCPRSGEHVQSRTPNQILEAILALPEGAEIELRAPVFKVYGEEIDFVLPGDPWARWYHSVIDTTLEGDPGAHDNVTYDGGVPITLAPRSLLLLRADPEAWSAT